jgi:alpha-galactosidase
MKTNTQLYVCIAYRYDDCNDQNLPYVPRYKAMRDAIIKTGRPMIYSICTARYHLWQPVWSRPLGHSWRTTTDIGDFWQSIMNNLDGNNVWWQWAGRGGWNDADMLQVGNGGLTYDEEISHFSLWCAIKSPLIAGNDLTTMSAQTLSILTNTELIAINQDQLGQQAHLVYNVSHAQVWSGILSDGAVVAVLLNRDDHNTMSITANWSDIGLPAGVPALVRDLWQHHDIINATDSVTIDKIRPHGSVTLRITAVGPMHQPPVANA